MKILVTGGAGFVGTRLAQALLKRGHLGGVARAQPRRTALGRTPASEQLGGRLARAASFECAARLGLAPESRFEDIVRQYIEDGEANPDALRSLEGAGA